MPPRCAPDRGGVWLYANARAASDASHRPTYAQDSYGGLRAATRCRHSRFCAFQAGQEAAFSLPCLGVDQWLRTASFLHLQKRSFLTRGSLRPPPHKVAASPQNHNSRPLCAPPRSASFAVAESCYFTSPTLLFWGVFGIIFGE